jgi:alkylated DNA repair protein alkB family protein 1
VILPSFISKQKQRDLVKWSLARHARQPNDTNLDIHYHLPTEGLWNSWLSVRDDPGKDFFILPKALASGPPQDLLSGPRKLVNNEPVSPETFRTISSVPKPPQDPSPTLQPTLVSSLIHKLRWANIGWFYHWGTKQYDFTKGKVAIDDKLRSVCKEAVRAVDWEQVHSSHDDDWGGGGPDWHTWDLTYGKTMFCAFHFLFI